MAVQVDPLREEVRADDRAWPFALDCRDDVATIELGGATYRLRPLRWREKRHLARYAALGEQFVERQLVRVCLAEATPLPTDRQQYQVLAELARWISAPGGSVAALPLDPVLLARVGLAVAHQTGAASSALEAESADVVESLWRPRPADRSADRSERAAEPPPAEPAAAPEPPPAEPAARSEPPPAIPSALPDPGDMVRILIVPDPPAAPPGPDATAPPALAASPDFVDLAPSGPPPTAPPSRGSAPARPLADPASAPARPLADPASAPARPLADPASAPARSRFRVRWRDAAAGAAPAGADPAAPAPPPTVWPDRAVEGVPESTTAPTDRPALDRPTPAAARLDRDPADAASLDPARADGWPAPAGAAVARPTGPNGVGALAPNRLGATGLGAPTANGADGALGVPLARPFAARSEGVAPPSFLEPDPLASAGGAPVATRPSRLAPLDPSAPPPRARTTVLDPLAPARRPDDDGLGSPSPFVDDLFDEWAERLEQAAEQMGVDLED